MNLDYTAEEESFRAEVRAFFEAELPADIRCKVRLGRRMHKDDLVRWQKILYRRGWGAGMWPRRYGGADWSGEAETKPELGDRRRSAGPPRGTCSGRIFLVAAFGADREQQCTNVCACHNSSCQRSGRRP